MTSRTELGLTLTVDGASEAELMRGLRAAIAQFDAAGVSPRDAAAAHFKREGWDVTGFDATVAPTAAEMNTAELWDAAREDALAACCAGWPGIPAGSSLDVA
jgi:hypothetical protein